MDNVKTSPSAKLQLGSLTTREIASIVGISPQNVNARMKQLFPNKQVLSGVPTKWTEEEVTVYLDEVNNHPSNNSSSNLNVEHSSNLSTTLTPMYKAKQFCASADFDSDEGRKAVTATILDLCQGLLMSLSKQNDMLKHQVEYNATIGCSRWKDVKKLFSLNVNKDTMLADTGLEENVDYFEKCMGYDKFPTLLLTDNAVRIIKETYNL